jgi:hypothetical protein
MLNARTEWRGVVPIGESGFFFAVRFVRDKAELNML